MTKVHIREYTASSTNDAGKLGLHSQNNNTQHCLLPCTKIISKSVKGLTESVFRDWRNGPAVKSTGCSYKRPGFNSQCPHGSMSHMSVSPVSENPVLSSEWSQF